jgi:hypothetical protein
MPQGAMVATLWGTLVNVGLQMDNVAAYKAVTFFVQ